MKKLIIGIILFIAICSSALATIFVRSGNYSEGWISKGVYGLNDTGLWVHPDSYYVLVLRDSSSVNAFTYTSYCDDGNVADSGWIDTAVYRGTTFYYFKMQILTLANAIAQPGGYHGEVVCFADGQKNSIPFSFQIIDSTTALSVAMNNLDVATSSRFARVGSDSLAGTMNRIYSYLNATPFNRSTSDSLATVMNRIYSYLTTTPFSRSASDSLATTMNRIYTYLTVTPFSRSTSDSLATVMSRIYSYLTASPPTTAQIADGVWDEDSTGHLVAGRMASSASQTGTGTADWTTGEKQQMRNALGVTGDTATLAAYGMGDLFDASSDTLYTVKNVLDIPSADTISRVTNEVRVVSTDTLTTLLGNVNGSVASVTGQVAINSAETLAYLTNEVRINSAETLAYLTNEARVVSTETLSVLTNETRIVSSETLSVLSNEARLVSSETLAVLTGEARINSAETLAYIGDIRNNDTVYASNSVTTDTASIARSVWDNDVIALVNRRIQHAESLGEAISATATINYDSVAQRLMDSLRDAGAVAFVGANMCSLVVLDGSGDPIEGVDLQIQNGSGVFRTRDPNLTNSNGVSYFKLDTLTSWRVLADKNLYAQNNTYDTFTVLASHLYDTVLMTAYVIPIPIDPRAVTLWLCFKDFGLDERSGAKLTCKLNNSGLVQYSDSSAYVDPSERTFVVASDGIAYVKVVRSSEMTPANLKYKITIPLKSGGSWTIDMLAPDQTTYRIRK